MMSRPGATVGEVLMPIAVVTVVGMMVFPLPVALLDLLLVANISFSLALIVAAVYLNEPERFTSLPAILLLSTLFRLGLNISTTRVILSSGEAPEIVSAFGAFVVGGNLIVGAVIFLIITVVQFLVIAKGAERVAEVAARFTLDAMPGKQMSIDADVRAGIISLSEARERRRELHRESKLYGSLDGAMKFIKGDAIAGVLITVINIGAGLLLGVSMHELTVFEALQRYTLFTVGDGLVSQIPALLVSVSAGIVVTRVGDKEDSLIGRDVFEQIGREPRALITTGVVLCLMALVPGMPTMAFLAMAGFMLVTGHRGARNLNAAETHESGEFKPTLNSVLVVKMTADALRAARKENRLNIAFEELKAQVFERRGVMLPGLRYELLDGAGSWYEIVVRGGRVRRAEFESAQVSRVLFGWLGEFLEKHIAELVDDTQTRLLLDLYQPQCEELINSLIPTVLSTTALTSVLRELAADKVSIREFGTVLQAIGDYLLDQPPSRGPQKRSEWDVQLKQEIVSAVRRAMGRAIVGPFVNGEWCMECFALDPEVEELLYEATKMGLAADQRLVRFLRETVVTEVSAGKAQAVVVVTSKAVRPIVREVLRQESRCVVMAYEELPQELSLVIKRYLTFESSDPREEAGFSGGRVVALRA